jgi:polyhydroxybutyrate depolymerase
VTLLLLACTSDDPTPREKPVVFHEYTFGGDRPVEPVGPDDWRPGEEPLPLVILLHGFGATPEAQDLLLRFSPQVEAERFLLLVPQGTENDEGTFFWNATDACCGWNSGVDDVAYLTSLIDEAEDAWGEGVSEVFITGHSNGGFMSYRMACDVPDRIDGIAPLAGAPWADGDDCAVGDPVPVLHIHGDTDDSVLYEGEGSYPGAVAAVERWAERAGCGALVDGEALDLVDGVPGSETTVLDYQDCSHPVSLWTMEGVGHVPLVNDLYLQSVLDWLQD